MGRHMGFILSRAFRGTIKGFFGGSMKPCCGCDGNMTKFRWKLNQVRDKLSVFEGRMKSSYEGAKKEIDSVIKCVEYKIVCNCPNNLSHNVSHWQVKCKTHKKEG